MRLSQLSLLAIPALVAASPPVLGPVMNLEQFNAERAVPEVAIKPLQGPPTVTTIPNIPSPTPTNLRQEEQDKEAHVLELRQPAGQDNLGTTLDQATQAATVTSPWVESTIDGTTTWIQVFYTQTFASVPDQWTTSGSGSIGLGTVTGTVGVVKVKSGATAVLPSGTLVTVALGVVGMIAGMGMVIL